MGQSPVGEGIQTILYSLVCKVIQKKIVTLQSGYNMDVMPPSSFTVKTEKAADISKPFASSWSGCFPAADIVMEVLTLSVDCQKPSPNLLL